jgi:hypothetical protein
MMQATSPEASSFGQPWFALTVAFALHVLDESHDGIPRYLQPYGDRNAGAPWVVPDADIRLSRMADSTDRRCGALFCTDPARRAQCAMAASAGVVLRACHVLQRTRTYCGDHPRAHGCEHARRATGAGILFLAISFRRIGVVDYAVVEDGFQNPRSDPVVILSGVFCREGRLQHRSTSKCTRPSAQTARLRMTSARDDG